MARTTRQVIERALRIIGVLGAGETASADDASDGLLALNQMLDYWSSDALMVFNILEVNFPLVAGTKTYTIGTGGTFNTPRPVQIEYAFTRDSTGLDRSITLIDAETYASIILKSLPNTYPAALFYYEDFPLGQVNLYPSPMAGLTLYLGVWDAFSEYANLDASVAYPPGYEFAITYSLAELLAPEYGKPAPPDVARAAAMARGNIRSNNLPTPSMAVEFGNENRGVTYADFMRGFS